MNHLVEVVYQHGQEIGDYIFIKDPNKQMMRLYKKTSEDLDDDEEDEEL